MFFSLLICLVLGFSLLIISVIIITRKDLRDIDDGEFEKIGRRARDRAGGDEALMLQIMTQSILPEFVRKAGERAEKKRKEREEEEEEGNFRRKRTYSRKPSPTTTQRPSVSVEVASSSDHDYNNGEASSSSSAMVLPEEFQTKIRQMGGVDPMLVLEKKVNRSDVDRQQHRFSLPPKKIKPGFLTKEEKTAIDINGESVQVTVIEPCLDTTSLTFKRWIMSDNLIYLLNGKRLDKMISDQTNGLREGATVQVWAFRVNHQLCFALVNSDLDRRPAQNICGGRGCRDSNGGEE